jgi:hypothetical protein
MLVVVYCIVGLFVLGAHADRYPNVLYSPLQSLAGIILWPLLLIKMLFKI